MEIMGTFGTWAHLGCSQGTEQMVWKMAALSLHDISVSIVCGSQGSSA